MISKQDYSQNKRRIDFSSIQSTGMAEENQRQDKELPQGSLEKAKTLNAQNHESAERKDLDLKLRSDLHERERKEEKKEDLIPPHPTSLRTQTKVRKYAAPRKGKKISPTVPMETIKKLKMLTLNIQENRDNLNDPSFNKAETKTCNISGVTNAFFDTCLHFLGPDFPENLPSKIVNEVQLRDFLIKKISEAFEAKKIQ